MDATTSDLLGALARAFPPQPLDPAILADPDGWWSNYYSVQAFEAGCRGHSWDTLEPAFVESHWGALTWMNPDAFAAFIPAFLASLVRGDTENMLPPMVLMQLTRREGREERFDTRAAHLTEQQHAVIVRVLEAIALGERLDNYRPDINAALDSWRAVVANPPPASDIPGSSPAPEDAARPSAAQGQLAGEHARPAVGRMPETHDMAPIMSDLLEELIAAFPPAPIDPAVFASPIGCWKEYLRARQFEAGTVGRSWNTLIPELVEINEWAPAHMDPDAFAAFIPAYLAFHLRGDMLEQTPLQLTRIPGEEAEFDARVAQFSAAQRAVIARVLEALANDDHFIRYRPEIIAARDSWRAVLMAGEPASSPD